MNIQYIYQVDNAKPFNRLRVRIDNRSYWFARGKGLPYPFSLKSIDYNEGSVEIINHVTNEVTKYSNIEKRKSRFSYGLIKTK